MAEPAVATFGRGDGEAFLGRVDADHLRTEGDHVEVRIFLKEESALESGMDSEDLGFGLKEIDIGFLDNLQERGVRIRCPSGVSVTMRHFVASEGESLLHCPLEMVFGRLDRGTLGSIYFYEIPA